MNDSGDRFALARSRLSSRHGAAPREMITAHRLWARRTDLILLAARRSPLAARRSRPGGRLVDQDTLRVAWLAPKARPA